MPDAETKTCVARQAREGYPAVGVGLGCRRKPGSCQDQLAGIGIRGAWPIAAQRIDELSVTVAFGIGLPC